MDKFAQRRTIWNKLHESFSPTGNAAEKFFNPEFARVMNDLRQKDDNIRSIVAGEKIGNGDPGRDKIALKELVKRARSNFNRREYMIAVSLLGRFHDKLYEIADQIGKLNDSLDEVHHQFLFKHLTNEDGGNFKDQSERQEYLESLKKLKERFAKNQSESITKEAGIMDFFFNVGTTRGRGLAAWEKKYPEKTAKLKAATSKQIDEAESLLKTTLAQLKLMATSRASREADEYVKQADVIFKKFGAYDLKFQAYYKEHVKGFLEKMFPAEAAKPAEQPTAAPAVETAPNSAPGSYSPGHEATPPSSYGDPAVSPAVNSLPLSDNGRGFEPTPPSSYGPGPGGGVQVVVDPKANPVHNTMMSPGAVLPPPSKVPQIDPLMNLSPLGKEYVNRPANNNYKANKATAPVDSPKMSQQEMRALEKQHGIVDEANVIAHRAFYETLESLAGESPAVLGKFISKYATSIQHSDPVTAIQLLKIASRIKG